MFPVVVVAKKSSLTVLAALAVFGSSVVACGGSSGGTDGANGKSALSTLAPEPAGSACAAGGTRVSTGLDNNASGSLDPDEVVNSQVVCNGKSETAKPASAAIAPLMNIDVEAKGTNCGAGGVRVQAGADADANGKLDVAEITSTKYVCNGDPAPTGTMQTVAEYKVDVVPIAAGATTTVIKATLKAPGKGKIIAFSNADIYCASPAAGLGYDCAPGTTMGGYTLSTSDTAGVATDKYDFFYLTPNATENSSRTGVFDVPAAGDITVHLRGQAQTGQIGFFRNQLTLVFIPG